MADELPVIIAGGGPVGLALAIGLAHHAVPAILLERNLSIDPHSRAPGLLTRTLEIFRVWGVLDDFLAHGTFLPEVHIYRAGDNSPAFTLELSSLAERSSVPGVMFLPQNRTEELLQRALSSRESVDLRRGHSVTGFSQDKHSVTVEVTPLEGEPYQLRGRFLVGCDGAHSTVRHTLGWELEGKTYPTRALLADIRLNDNRNDLPFPRTVPLNRGVLAAIRMEGTLWRIIATMLPEESEETATSERAITERVEALFGDGPYELVWRSTFNIHCRTSPHFRNGRVLLAGDAAHINSPAGGQGMNSGIQDAFNLSWKLARAMRGGDVESLLMSYEQERRAFVLQSVDQFTDLLTRIGTQLSGGLRGWLMKGAAWAMEQTPVRDRLLRRMAMLDSHYASSELLNGTGPAVGRRIDAELTLNGTSLRLMDVVSTRSCVLLYDDGRYPRWDASAVQAQLEGIPEVDVKRIVGATVEADEGDLKDVLDQFRRHGKARSNVAMLVRPDGHIGWSEERPTTASLRTGVAKAIGHCVV